MKNKLKSKYFIKKQFIFHFESKQLTKRNQHAQQWKKYNLHEMDENLTYNPAMGNIDHGLRDLSCRS